MEKYFAQYDEDGKLLYSERVDDATIPKGENAEKFLYYKGLCFHLGAEAASRETGKHITAEITEVKPADKVAPVLEEEAPLVPDGEK